MRRACTGSRLSAYLDGELSSEDAAQLKQHLAQCPACRARLRALERVAATLRRGKPAAPRPRVDLLRGVRHRFPAATFAPPGLRAVGRWAVACAIAGAIILGVRAGIPRSRAAASEQVGNVRATVDFRHNTVVTVVSWPAPDQEPAK